MKKLKEVNRDQYSFHSGDLVVFESAKTRLIDRIVTKCKGSYAIFNWKGNQNSNDDVDYSKYIDEQENIDIDYIERKCKELFRDRSYIAAIINDIDGKVRKDKNFGKRLKQLSKDLNRIIIVVTNFEEKSKIKSIIDKKLVKYADLVLLGDEDIIVKNKHGKTGILNYEVGEDE